MLQAKEMRDQSTDELQALVYDTRIQLFSLINEKKQTKKLETPHLIREKKRDIARLLTVLAEKRANQSKEG